MRGGTSAGDVAALGGDLNLGAGAIDWRRCGDCGGRCESGAGSDDSWVEHGVAGRDWLLLPFAPLLILIGVIWLIVWIVRRNRYQFPVYPQGRGF